MVGLTSALQYVGKVVRHPEHGVGVVVDGSMPSGTPDTLELRVRFEPLILGREGRFSPEDLDVVPLAWTDVS